MRRSRGLWVGANATSATGTVTPTIDRPSLAAAVFLIIAVYSPSGLALGELQTHGLPDRLVWQVDGHTTIRLFLDPDVLTDKPGLVSPGNRVVIYLSNGLPAWGGVIDVPFEKTYGLLAVTCYSAEYLFTWALTPAYVLYEGDAAADARRVMIDLIEKVDMAGLYGVLPPYKLPQEPAPLDESVSVNFSYVPMSTALETLRDLDSHLHYFVQPAGNDLLLFETVAYRDAIQPQRYVPRLVEGRNFTDVEALDQGPIVNEVFIANAGADFSDPATTAITAFDANSVARYGRRQEFISVPEGAEMGRSLYEMAEAVVNHAKSPRLRFRGTALDLTPGRFTDMGLGHRVIIEMQADDERGVELNAAIIGMEWDSAANTLALVVEYTEELSLWD